MSDAGCMLTLPGVDEAASEMRSFFTEDDVLKIAISMGDKVLAVKSEAIVWFIYIIFWYSDRELVYAEDSN